MSNKKLMKEMFEQQFSADQNYQAINNRFDKKKKSVLTLFWQCALVPTFTIMLLVITGALNFNNSNGIYVNEIKPTISPARLYTNNEKYVVETNVGKYYPFVENIVIPTRLMNQSDVALYNIYMERHDYILKFIGSTSDRRVIISFIEIGIKSLRDNHIIDTADMQISRINEYDVVIAYSSLDNKYYAIFEYRGLSFTIEGYGVTLQELINILESILI